MILSVLITAWLLLGLVPVGWWAWSRRQVDTWAAMPIPAALIRADGTVRAATGPEPADGFRFEQALDATPPTGRVVRLHTRGGTPVAATGVRGGALVVALPADPLRESRGRLLADLSGQLAHDINTPLAALVGHLDLIAHQPISETASASVAICQREVQRLQTTTSDLLALTRLRANPTPRSVRLAGALAEDAAAAYLDRADQLGVELTVEVPTVRAAVSVAEADMVRALRNLIGNALRHGLPPGYADPDDSRLTSTQRVAGEPAGRRPDVVVGVDVDGDAVVFSVADRGAGLAPADLPRLCDPMVRGDGARGEGSGLGLAIVAEVLAGHGTELSCAPRRGGGTVVSFALVRQP